MALISEEGFSYSNAFNSRCDIPMNNSSNDKNNDNVESMHDNKNANQNANQSENIVSDNTKNVPGTENVPGENNVPGGVTVITPTGASYSG